MKRNDLPIALPLLLIVGGTFVSAIQLVTLLPASENYEANWWKLSLAAASALWGIFEILAEDS